jgi:uncharacterized protein YkwD
MHRLRPVLVAAALIAALVVRTQIVSEPGAAAHASPEVAWSRPLDGLRPGQTQPTTTTITTASPPPPTTTAPPPPPPAPAPARVRATAVRAPAPAPAPAVAAPDSEARALQLLNGERARAGLPPLRLNSGATSVARAWSTAMSVRKLAHNPNLSRDLGQAGVTGWAAAGENVGDGTSADQLHALFMASSGHRANILSSQFSEVGIGAVMSGGKLWLTMDFVGW